jgi:hypothetical protein
VKMKVPAWRLIKVPAWYLIIALLVGGLAVYLWYQADWARVRRVDADQTKQFELLEQSFKKLQKTDAEVTARKVEVERRTTEINQRWRQIEDEETFREEVERRLKRLKDECGVQSP